MKKLFRLPVNRWNQMHVPLRMVCSSSSYSQLIFIDMNPNWYDSMNKIWELWDGIIYFILLKGCSSVPYAKEDDKEALKHLSLAFREFVEQLSMLPLRYFRVISASWARKIIQQHPLSNVCPFSIATRWCALSKRGEGSDLVHAAEELPVEHNELIGHLLRWHVM